jgi:hypothetical protein
VVVQHAVPANVEVELLKYNASQPWYIGGHATKRTNDATYGDFALGGCGLFLSRGAVQWMQESYTSCALHTARPRDSGDGTLGRCVLLHGIPLTHHPGMHFADGWHPEMWQHRPAAPFLSIHDNRFVEWGPGMRQALAMNPYGFSQQARLRVSLPGRKRNLVVHISSGIAVNVWEAGTQGTDLFHLGMPGKWQPYVTNPPHVERSEPLGNFTVTDLQGPDPEGNCSIVTTYTASRTPAGSDLFSVVEVHEPFWPDRWRHAPTSLCVTAWGITTESSSSVSKLTVHLGRGPEGCIWEGFPSIWDPDPDAAV